MENLGYFRAATGKKNFTAACLVVCPLTESEPRADFVLKETSLLFAFERTHTIYSVFYYEVMTMSVVGGSQKRKNQIPVIKQKNTMDAPF